MASPEVPLHLYKHVDPLLRRLRLKNGFGEEVDLSKEFGADVKVVAFLFAASWTRSSAEAYKPLLDFARWQPHRFKLIYVSVDTDEKSYQANVSGREWLAMEWNDGSNLPTDRDPESPSPTPLPPLARNESFLLPLEPDLDYSLSLDDPTGTLYTRPYSRVYLADKFDVLGVPHLLVYSTEKRQIIDRWYGGGTWSWRMRGLEDVQRKITVWEKWESGEGSGVTMKEIFQSMRWILISCLFGLAFVIYAQTDKEGVESLVDTIYDKFRGDL